ncbi:MAG: universal stress protein [Halanaerobiales bacterium]|jgi:nucleotide-binding universal stress UspA family protein|nr:universal stress protein [Halanaerobiales bacterium]
MICEYAENNGFDIIVLADKGIGGVKRFFLGSISDKVLRHAKVSVLVVK